MKLLLRFCTSSLLGLPKGVENLFRYVLFVLPPGPSFPFSIEPAEAVHLEKCASFGTVERTFLYDDVFDRVVFVECLQILPVRAEQQISSLSVLTD